MWRASFFPSRSYPPAGPSRSLTVTQALAVLKAAEKDRLQAYVVLSLVSGIRTEEARALTWDHVHLDTPTPSVDVWRSVRAGGDVKTRTSRRSLALPDRAVTALEAHREAQDEGEGRLHGPVARARAGLHHPARRAARRAQRAPQLPADLPQAAGIGEDWTPRDLRHSFVSIMSSTGVPIEEIARLVGHAGGSRVTEAIYRKEIRPVLMTGAEVMDRCARSPSGRWSAVTAGRRPDN